MTVVHKQIAEIKNLERERGLQRIIISMKLERASADTANRMKGKMKPKPTYEYKNLICGNKQILHGLRASTEEWSEDTVCFERTKKFIKFIDL